MLKIVAILVFACYSSVSGQGWTQIPRGLVHVSGNLNYIWGLDKDMKIYLCTRPCTGGWKLIGGLLVQLDVDDEFVWGVNKNDDIFVRSVDGSGSWKHISGKLIHVTASGNSYVWGTNRAKHIFKCKKPCRGGSGWKRVNGALKMIDGGEREVCGVSRSNHLYCRSVDAKRGWRHLGGGFKYVTTSGPYDIFAVTTKEEIYRCRKPCIGQWIQVGHDKITRLSQCDATADAMFGVDSGQSVWRKDFPM